MGWETLAITGFSLLSANQSMKQGDAAANAAVQQGQNEIQNSANSTVMDAGKVRNSFLSSGIALDGGPMAAINQIFNTGNTNIQRIATNANAQSANAVNSARSAALSSLAKSALGSAAGGASGAWSSVDSFTSNAWNNTSTNLSNWWNNMPTSSTAPILGVTSSDLTPLGA